VHPEWQNKKKTYCKNKNKTKPKIKAEKDCQSEGKTALTPSMFFTRESPLVVTRSLYEECKDK
jgi:hypothetical protein